MPTVKVEGAPGLFQILTNNLTWAAWRLRPPPGFWPAAGPAEPAAGYRSCRNGGKHPENG